MSQNENTNESVPNHSEKWRWNEEKLQWEYRDNKGRWFFEHRSLPLWFIEAGATISTRRFCTIWQRATSLNDVKKELFWCSLNEIEEQKELINQLLQANSLQELKELELKGSSLLTIEEILELEQQGILFREPHGRLQGEEYDPMQALLEAQRKEIKQEGRHIQTMEISHKRRFSIRH